MTMERDLDLRLVRSFLAVASELSFTRAARRLGLSQSTISARVRQLEEHFSQPLLDRDTHSVRLTPAGERFLTYGHRIIALADEALDESGFRHRRHTVRFGVSEDFAFTHLPAFLERLRIDQPLLDVELSIHLSAELHRRLRSAESDIILAMRPGPSRGVDALEVEPLFSDRLVWAARTGYQRPRGEPLPLVLYPRPSVTRDAAIGALESHGVAYRTAATSTSLAGLRAAALSGIGVMPFAESLIPGGLSIVDDPDLPPMPGVVFALATRRTPTRATRNLAQALRDHRADFTTDLGDRSTR
ncbi:MAG TPA: LysR family transcriptional regulator [Candidatus Dietzia intestinigallinarum]|nr:LysR family transcriptional regulator [Candidatus Dietzia intestinigallinarum]